jgi:acid phosphatase type 7
LSYVSRRTFLRTSAAALGIAPFARAAAGGLLRQPYLQRLLADKASILWTTPQPAAGNVTVIAPDGSSTSFSATATAFEPSTTQLSSTYYQYQADLTGLQAGTTYRYQIVQDGQVLASDPVQNSFHTPTSGDFSFLVMGDTGTDSPEQISLLQQMIAETNVSKVIHVGDLAYMSGTFGQFESNYFAQYAPLMSRLPFFTAPGNHEYLTASAAPYLAVHSAPVSGVPSQDVGRYYSFDWGDAHFVSLDSNLLPGDAGARMLGWLDADLAATKKYWKIAFVHHPPYPTGAHLGDPLCALVEKNVNPIVERHGVQVVLAGHEHGYERSFPLRGGQKADASVPSTTYLITGGGGAFLENVGSLPQCVLSVSAHNYLRVDVAGTALTFSAIGLGGAVIDRITLNPPPAVAPGGIVNARTLSTDIFSGALVRITGQNFSIRSLWSSRAPAPHQLGGVSVTVNGVDAPVLYASPGELIIQIPFGVSGAVTLNISTPNGSATGSAEVEKRTLVSGGAPVRRP